MSSALCSFSNLSFTSPTSQLIFQPFRRFTYSQLILQPFRCFTYVILQPFFRFCLVTGSSLTSPDEPPMHVQNLLSSLNITERHSTLQSTLSRHQSSRAWWCHGVSGSLARGTSYVNPAASRRFPTALGDAADVTFAPISSLAAVLAATGARAKRRS